MPTLSLWTLDEERVGFMLLAGKESLALGSNPRDCVFMSAPGTAQAVEHILNHFLTEFRATEFSCTLFQSGEEWGFTVPINEELWTQLHCTPSATGTWRIQQSNGDSWRGRCRLVATTE